MDKAERKYWEESPKGMEPKGHWEWSYASGHWQFCLDEEVVLELSEVGLVEMRGRVPQTENFIEVFEGTFYNSIIIRRIFTDDHDAVIAFLRERGVDLSDDDL